MVRPGKSEKRDWPTGVIEYPSDDFWVPVIKYLQVFGKLG